MQPSPLTIFFLPFLFAVAIVVGGVYPYLREEYVKWHENWMATRTQQAHVQANEAEISRLWIEARLRLPGYHVDGRSADLYQWIEQEQPLLRREEVGLILPVQEELIEVLEAPPHGR